MACESHVEFPAEQAAVEGVFTALHAYIAVQTERQRNPDGAHKAERSANSRDAQAKLEKYKHLERPVIGRMTMEDGFTIIVGGAMINDEDAQLLTCDWREEFGAVFEQATSFDPMGLTLRRQFKLDERILVDFEDLFDFRESRHATPDPATATERKSRTLPSGTRKLPDKRGTLAPSNEASPQVSDFLLEALRKRRSGSMDQIVATIQAEQSRVLRTDPNTLLVIQGSPGTGKTGVGLHRASWIMFNELRRSQLRSLTNEESMLIVGPNEAFIQYIKGVLPSLGDLHVSHRSITRFGSDLDATLVESPAARQLKGEARMAGLLERGLRQRIMIPSDGLPLDDESGDMIPAEQLRELVDKFSTSTYLGGRTSFITTLTQRFSNGEPDRTDRIERLAGKVWPRLTSEDFLAEFFDSGTQLLLAAKGAFTADELVALRREKAGRRGDLQWSLEDRPLLDHVSALLNGPKRQFRHIVIDEAQDLSPMQLMLLSRRSTTGAFTVLGDVAQSTGPWSRGDWSDAFEILKTNLPTKLLTLEVGYRVPAEIMEFANKLLPLIAPDLTRPLAIRSEGIEPRVLIRPSKDGEHAIDDDDGILIAEEISGLIDEKFNVGVIAVQEDLVAIRRVLTSLGWKWGSVGDSSDLHSAIVTLTPQEAKGLEFDATVVINPQAIVSSGHDGLRLLYVALTRATQRLSVVLNADGALLPDDLPGTLKSAESSRQPRPITNVEAIPGMNDAVLNLARLIQANVDDGISINAFEDLVRAAIRLGDRDDLGSTEPQSLLRGDSPASSETELADLNDTWLLHFKNYPTAAQEAFSDGQFVRLDRSTADFQVPLNQLEAANEQKPYLTSSLEAILRRTTKVSFVIAPSEGEH